MRELLKRLDRLEGATMARNREPIRIIRQIIEPGGGAGGAMPWNPTRAECGGQVIERQRDETPEAFQDRAVGAFPGMGRIIIGREPRRGDDGGTSATH
jgi:hypothetical protein